MRQCFLLLIFILIEISAFAEKQDSLFVSVGSNGWIAKHKVTVGEDVFMLSIRYHVPPAVLSAANNITYQEQLQVNSKIIIPLGGYNLITSKPANTDARPLYFKVNNENLQHIARITGVSQRTIQSWNSLETNELYKGQVLTVGWVLYENTDLIQKSKLSNAKTSPIRIEEDGMSGPRIPHTETIIIKMPDTARIDTLSEGERLFMAQTSDGTVVASEKGTGVFFKRAGKATNGIYFAFHNSARRGTILKLYNPGTDKTVYAKVIGKVPANGTFYNAVFGISSDAKTALGTSSDKVWCDISYAP